MSRIVSSVYNRHLNDNPQFVVMWMVAFAVFGWFCLTPRSVHATATALATTDVMTNGFEAFQHGHMEQAALMWQRAAHRYAATQQWQARSVALTHLARAYIELGHVDRAAKCLLTALHDAKTAGDARQQALVLASLSQLTMRHDLEEANAQLTEALIQAYDLSDAGLIATILHDQGNLFLRQQRPRDALTAYRDSAAAAKQQNHLGMAARALAHAARVAIQVQQPDSALAWLDDAVSSLRQEADSHETAYDFLMIGQLYQQLAEANADLVMKAFGAFEAALNMGKKLQDKRVLAYAWGYLGHLYEVSKRYADALILTRRAVLVAQQVHVPESLYQWEWQIARLLQALGEHSMVLPAYARALETVQTIQTTLRQGQDHANQSFRQTIGPLYFQYVDLLLQKATALEASATGKVYPAYDYYLQKAQRTIEQFKTSELQDYFGDACVDAARFQTTALERLSLNAAIIYPILLEDRTELLVSFPNGWKRVGVTTPGPRLERLTRTFRNALQARDPRRYLRHARRLYNLLIRPLEADLKSTVNTLVWVPDGVLRLLPLAALHDGERFLIETYALAVTPSLDLTDPRPLPPEKARVLAVGITEAVDNFPPLPFVRNELQSIHQLYGGMVLLNQEFSPSSLSQAVNHGQFSMLHIASHGEFAADPTQSFLLTSKGKLTLTQLAEMIGHLRYRETPLELLTLSACETAQGDDQTALGLAGVAIQSGARSALATLWRVADEATAVFMQTFYQHLSTPGTSRARALQQAQLALLHNPTYASPIFWAPFLLINNWL